MCGVPGTGLQSCRRSLPFIWALRCTPLLPTGAAAAACGKAARTPPCDRVLRSFFTPLEAYMSYLSIRDLDLKGKRVFIRVDFNVPLQKNEQGVMEITSDKRIKASLPTIQYALEQGAGVILASHLGRPKGKPNAEMSLRPIAARLEQLLGRPVKMAPDCIGREVEALKPAPGEVVLLENLRFHPEEEKNDPEFARRLASLCDVYVNDAFGSAHRAHASTEA